MSNKLQQWGATLLVFGAASLILPLIGVQLRVFNLFGANQRAAGVAAIVVGAVLWLVGKSKQGAQPKVAHSATATPPPVPPSAPAAGAPPPLLARCPKCGAEANPGDRFCMSCGNPLTAASAPPPVAATPVAAAPAAARPRAKRGHPFLTGCLLLVVLMVGGVALLLFGGFKSYKLPARSEPAVPTHVAGTLTEFPIDPDATAPLQPTSVTSQTFDSPSATQTVETPADTIPPGLNTTTIPQVATAMTSSTYSSSGQGNPTPVHVHVLQAGANTTRAPQIAQGIAQSSGGTTQGVRLQSPQGQTYEGYSVRSPQIMVYVLVNRVSSNIVILYTPQPAGFPAIQRLASSVGNGRGLREFPQVVDTYAALPAVPPPGSRLTTLRGFTGGQLRGTLAAAQGQMGPDTAKAMNQLIEAIRVLIPERGTMALYTDARGQERGVIVGSYGSGRKASIAWRMLSWTAGWGMKTPQGLSFPALITGDSSARVLIFHKGPYLAMVKVPGVASEDELLALARSVQI